MQSVSVPPSSENRSVGRLVARNTMYLALGQVLTIPLAALINAAMGRYLGAEEFGYVYLASTLVGFGFVAVEWGHSGSLPALVARARERAGIVLGSSLVWRMGMSIVTYLVLATGAHLMGYGAGLQWALALIFLSGMVTTSIGACKDTIQGFERTDIPSYIHVAQQLLTALLVLPVLYFGGRMRAALFAMVVAAAVMLLPTLRALRPVGVGKLTFERATARSLFVDGTPFVFFGVATVLVPNIDAVYLSKLAPPEVMGWYAASRRLVGLLLLPASALIGALYPTLCRLWSTDQKAFSGVVSGSLRTTVLMVVPVGLCCALYPEVGVSIFSRDAFGPAETNLRILAVFVFLVYFSMPIGTAVLAAGKQRHWAVVQSVCVLGSLVLDPLLVPWFQRKWGNGGVGLCVASTVSEVIVVVAGLALLPRSVYDRKLARTMLFCVLSGLAMAAAAFGTRALGPWVSAPIAVVTYGVAIFVTGAVEPEQVAAIRALIARKVAAFRSKLSGS